MLNKKAQGWKDMVNEINPCRLVPCTLDLRLKSGGSPLFADFLGLLHNLLEEILYRHNLLNEPC